MFFEILCLLLVSEDPLIPEPCIEAQSIPFSSGRILKTLSRLINATAFLSLLLKHRDLLIDTFEQISYDHLTLLSSELSEPPELTLTRSAPRILPSEIRR